MVSSVYQSGADWSSVLKAFLQLRLVWREFLPPGGQYGKSSYLRLTCDWALAKVQYFVQYEGYFVGSEPTRPTLPCNSQMHQRKSPVMRLDYRAI